MFLLKPIPESQADGGTLKIYQSVKQTLGLQNVPIIFQYLAVFPNYLEFIWQQALKNLNDREFINQAKEIENFAQTAINQIYIPSTGSKLFLEKVENRAEKMELSRFVETSLYLNSSLYILSLAIRESVKGIYLGIKQIEEKVEEKEKIIFNDLSEGFFSEDIPKNEQPLIKKNTVSQAITTAYNRGLATSVYGEFFKFMDWEMEKLVKKEEYLTRRVELERYALSLLSLLPHPLESSFKTVTKQTSQNPLFPELIYLIAELFPTQTPYKLLSSAVMKKALFYKREYQEEKPSSPILLPGEIG